MVPYMGVRSSWYHIWGVVRKSQNGTIYQMVVLWYHMVPVHFLQCAGICRHMLLAISYVQCKRRTSLRHLCPAYPNRCPAYPKRYIMPDKRHNHPAFMPSISEARYYAQHIRSELLCPEYPRRAIMPGIYAGIFRLPFPTV